jgi:DNA-binding CsgD family transcriptional regulator
LADLRDKLKVVYTNLPASPSKKTVKEILSKLEVNLIQEKEWGLFTKVFEEVHDGFFQELSEKHGTLSASELRLCALIKLNLISRDIATSLGISDDSLRIARYRLKKRLGLSSTEKLSVYLRSLNSGRLLLNHSISED